MEKYRIEFRKSVEKDLKAIPEKDSIRILQKIQALSFDPRPSTCKKLSGQDRYRIRQGNYRILYEICDDVLLITIVKTGHRRDIYE